MSGYFLPALLCVMVAGPAASVTAIVLGADCSRRMGSTNKRLIRVDGLSTSLVAGPRDLSDHTEGMVVIPGDMPFIEPLVIDRLIEAFVASDRLAICVPMYRGRRGNPVLWPRELFPDISLLTGDRGARSLLERHSERVRGVAVSCAGVVVDIDTPEDLRHLRETGLASSPGESTAFSRQV